MDQSLALKILKSGANVFLTGEPGSGKTYLINQYVSYLNSHDIKPAITASTGIAATHIGGITIHSWSGIGIRNRLARGDLNHIAGNSYVKKRINKARVLIIDEISMLPPETLQMIDAICREIKNSPLPFGGLQLILVGDFFQLPPVTRRAVFDDSNEYSQENLFEELPMRFAFEAPVFAQMEFVTCYLSEQHRQNDDNLSLLLSKIRKNSFDDLCLSLIEKRVAVPAQIPEYIPRLFSHNMDVDRINDQMLATIPGEPQFFAMQSKGHEALINVMKKGCLSPDKLYLKIGASVMFTKNNPKEGYVNGTLGVVEGFKGINNFPLVKTKDGKLIEVEYAEWLVEEDGKIKGRISQLPLRLAWAITVHKSQGISLDAAVIDLSKVFEFGQGYVALSRVKTLEGIQLLGWNQKAFEVDADVARKDKQFFQESLNAEKMYGKLSEEEFETLFQEFIIASGGEIDISDISIPSGSKKQTTFESTLALWKEGMGIEAIAKARNLSTKTIFGHIQQLHNENKLSSTELNKLARKELIQALPEIKERFNADDSGKLTPVFEFFKAKFSYDELKLARILIKSE